MKKTELFFSFLFAIGVLIVAAMIAYIGFLAHWTVGLLSLIHI